MTDTRREPLPVYKVPGGDIRPISGKAAEAWPSPRVMVHEDDGALFIEWPMPWETGWGLTFHTSLNWDRTFVGEFLAQYVEGRASGFPFWPTLYYAARVTLLHHILRRPARC